MQNQWFIFLLIVKDLITNLASKNLDVSKKDGKGNTVFHVAAKSGNIAAIEMLIDKKEKHHGLKNEEVIFSSFKLLLYLISKDCYRLL